mmetsp:Transcript_21815/g.60733  ORF Transcript_21815/g.60733 Transcript_21815/m.60733 type:complete len:89 (+) Transcript_21815:888-1154(+)|eukprot:CAMPEP_0198127046 /NCGR_PEP_ID=MMETSP1442-20131203/46319_1 /TAXON_ID= /ORGANISM="Craspedostauros australis, Strain CCMP3328" /LENGTH=88 /DNA_ID=CAMNT_0043786963 /DNA_START=870 /DNA_END=1136 /DNA_ORIENTATION=+
MEPPIHTTPPPMLDLPHTPSCVLHPQTGKPLRCDSRITPHEMDILFRMLVEVGSLQDKNMRRFNVTYPDVRYTVVRDAHYVYIVKCPA